MKLSELNNSATAYIDKVKGSGAFRKRINEMGIIPGAKITAIKRAPLQDPVEYQLMGYRISLRTSEAEMIEISTLDESDDSLLEAFKGMIPVEESEVYDTTIETKKVRIALIGNPNCGKTTLFNHATGSNERVGNFSGVTVDMKSVVWQFKDYTIELIDLPGTYSLSEYSPEELYVRNCLKNDPPDIVINVVDASNLERNLYLTTQLIDMNLKMVIALNMFDDLLAKGDHFDYVMMAEMIGIPIVPTTASKGTGIQTLFERAIECYEEEVFHYRHLHINYGDDINQALSHIKHEIEKRSDLAQQYHRQYIAIKLLEKDTHMREEVYADPHTAKAISVAQHEIDKLEKNYADTSDSIIAGARYSFIRGALKETLQTKHEISERGYRADKILTNKWLAIPVFLLILGSMFQITFTLGNYPMEWIESGIELISQLIATVIPEGILHDLLIDGVIAGVGGVLVFLPNIVLLFLFISMLEDSGYMARAAFIMDKLMHQIGLHGKSFIPLLMGFGCNVPAVLATRTLESRKDRLVTMLIIPFMSCSARLPIYILLVSTFFTQYKGLILLSIYMIGILIAILSAWTFNKFLFRGKEAPFVMELPPYRMPALRNTLRHTWGKSKEYLYKMGGVILVASILIWALGYFPRGSKEEAYQLEDSYIAQVGHFIAPVLEPLGYDWKIGVSLISGVAAKEIVVSTMSVLYHSNEAEEDGTLSSSSNKNLELKAGIEAQEHQYTPYTAYSLMIFVLLYFPCVSVLAAIKNEGGIKWAFFSIFYTTSLAWIIAFTIHQIGRIML